MKRFKKVLHVVDSDFTAGANVRFQEIENKNVKYMYINLINILVFLLIKFVETSEHANQQCFKRFYTLSPMIRCKLCSNSGQIM